jgi:hypothetical protein
MLMLRASIEQYVPISKFIEDKGKPVIAIIGLHNETLERNLGAALKHFRTALGIENVPQSSPQLVEEAPRHGRPKEYRLKLDSDQMKLGQER